MNERETADILESLKQLLKGTGFDIVKVHKNCIGINAHYVLSSTGIILAFLLGWSIGAG